MQRLRMAMLGVALVACSDSTAPNEVRIAGNYTLQTINGQPLPFELFNFLNGSYVLTQVGGMMTLNENASYREQNIVRESFIDAVLGPVVNDTTIVFNGTYEKQDSTVLLTSSPGGLVSFGFVSGNRLTLSFESGDSLFTFIYNRN